MVLKTWLMVSKRVWGQDGDVWDMDKDRLSCTCCMYNDFLEKDTLVSIACLSKFPQICE